ncbi:hypothetical protein CWB41_08860 [Methylovirgula ligni]|uniref:UPF0235 protein DES32_2587 n=1 Tax=Methylovirgula ligni TaxID=569860 RepID=A0A3D9Z052_9HYPH|nr:DUF167 family protein [Methylovirgula ligni]QAY95831.1 hypothetical protein CWB41_08860 [Methylovirgula ligni]REF86532.1 hypothetical protein DES32_2587 [Methylovirgula ligni]
MPEGRPWTARKDGLALAVRLTPKSSRDEIVGVEALADGRAVLKVRVRALPEAGAANEALIRLLAKSLGVAPSSLHLESGGSSRLKSVHLAGDAAALATKLAGLAR